MGWDWGRRWRRCGAHRLVSTDLLEGFLEKVFFPRMSAMGYLPKDYRSPVRTDPVPHSPQDRPRRLLWCPVSVAWHACERSRFITAESCSCVRADGMGMDSHLRTYSRKCAVHPALYSSALPVLARLYRTSSVQRKKSTSVRRESSRLDSLNTSRSDIGTPSLTPHTPSRCQQLRRRGRSVASSTPPRWMSRVDLRTLRCRRRRTRRSAAMALLGCSRDVRENGDAMLGGCRQVWREHSTISA
jgi:hypothetical protein